MSTTTQYVIVLALIALASVTAAAPAPTDIEQKDSPKSLDSAASFTTSNYRNFMFSGSASPSSDAIVLAHKTISRPGAIWARKPSTHEDWEAVFSIDVQGTVDNAGEGFAFWYAETPNKIGDTYGSEDRFNGLGLFFDSHDDNNNSDNPLLMGMLGDGKKVFNKGQDGAGSRFGGCRVNYRNRDAPTEIKVLYEKNTLSVLLNVRSTGVWEKCLEKKDVFLPSGYYFGLSASNANAPGNDEVKVQSLSVFKLGDQFDATPEGKEIEKEMQAEPTTGNVNLMDLTEELSKKQSSMHDQLERKIIHMVDRHHHTSREQSREVQENLGEIKNMLQSMMEKMRADDAAKATTATTVESSSNGPSWASWMFLLVQAMCAAVTVYSVAGQLSFSMGGGKAMLPTTQRNALYP
jgi:gas vesicle protein